MDKKRIKITKLEKECQKPDFWQDEETAARATQELANLKDEIREPELLNQEFQDFIELWELSKEDFSLERELREKAEYFSRRVAKEEFRAFLSDRYDKGNAILSIYAGAGGQDAQDWAAMLFRMYQRYCDKQGFKTKIISKSFGEAEIEGRPGIKQASMEIKGPYAFGFLKRESGVHRLVRISPFSSKSLRHTSFALIEVLPEIGKDAEKNIEINPKDLEISFYRASGPGGQYVNRRETAVRIVYLPAKITVTCQSERLQGQNKEIAMKILYSKIYQLREKEKEKELAKLKGKSVSIEWGSQIRSYVLHPYRLVKDLRTGVEVSDVDGILDGDIKDFIDAEIKMRKTHNL